MSYNELKLLRSQDVKKNLDDLTWITNFYEMLQGGNPDEGVDFGRGCKPKMSAKKAMSIIWYLQEVLSVFPSNIEQCSNCNSLYDTDNSGHHSEINDRFYCGACDYLAPYSKEE